jgi:hypothetical protein
MQDGRRAPRWAPKKIVLTFALAAALATGLSFLDAGNTTSSNKVLKAGTVLPDVENGLFDIFGIGGIFIFEFTNTITISTFGNGAGTVTSDVNGDAPDGNPLSCTRALGGVESGDCSDSYTYSIFTPSFPVTLTANPAPGSTFAGWSGDCAGLGPEVIDLAVEGDESCGATFTTDVTFPLAITTAGPGSGTVTATGINCVHTTGIPSGDCLESYPAGTVVAVSATAGANSTLALTGDCVALPCSVTMDAARSITATFNAVTFPLTVDIQGNGQGVVTSTSGPGIACAGNAGADGGDCSENVIANTNVTLQATAASGSTFVGSWGGACAAFGSNPTCTVSMTAAQAVTASFTLTGGGGGGGGGGACTISGNGLGNVLNGTPGPDIICGKGGPDVIRGRGGADIIRAGTGADIVYGGNGPDTIQGGNGPDTLRGGSGPDTITGGGGVDFANGGAGVDACVAETEISCP